MCLLGMFPLPPISPFLPFTPPPPFWPALPSPETQLCLKHFERLQSSLSFDVSRRYEMMCHSSQSRRMKLLFARLNKRPASQLSIIGFLLLAKSHASWSNFWLFSSSWLFSISETIVTEIWTLFLLGSLDRCFKFWWANFSIGIICEVEYPLQAMQIIIIFTGFHTSSQTLFLDSRYVWKAFLLVVVVGRAMLWNSAQDWDALSALPNEAETVRSRNSLHNWGQGNWERWESCQLQDVPIYCGFQALYRFFRWRLVLLKEGC